MWLAKQLPRSNPNRIYRFERYYYKEEPFYSKMKPNLEQLIKFLDLKPLENEGGLFRQTYLSPLSYQSAGMPGVEQSLCTTIYYLLTAEANDFSEMHRLTSDEIYHFYLGDPVEQLRLYPGGNGELVHLGQDILHGQQVQSVVPAGVWQGTRLTEGGEYALMGTTMAPGYRVDDYKRGDCRLLSTCYPEWQQLICRLTRM